MYCRYCFILIFFRSLYRVFIGLIKSFRRKCWPPFKICAQSVGPFGLLFKAWLCTSASIFIGLLQIKIYTVIKRRIIEE